MIEKLLCDIDRTVLDVLSIINENAKGIAFAVDKNRKLMGVITDGDIRRFLLKGGKIQDPVKALIKPGYIYAKKNESYQQMFDKINEDIKIIPIVDEEFKAVDFFECKTNISIPMAVPDLTEKELKYLMEAFFSTWISSKGEYIDNFEKKFSAFCGCNYGVAVSNGTVAMHLALLALGIGPGDEVIVPDLTFAATINVVLHANAKPVIVDVEKDSWCIDALEIEKAITPRTKAVIPVHIYGQPCDMDAIMNIAKKSNLYVIEDCAEAHGAKFGSRTVGSFGDIGCFSFFGNKVITTGEGGMCVTNSEILDEKMRVLRDHGMNKTKRYWHDCVGYNYRLTNMQAAVGLAQLERIDSILDKRKNIEQEYRNHLSDLKTIKFQENNLRKRNKITWLVCALVESLDRDVLLEQLKKKGIDSRPFFYPLSTMPVYEKYKFSNKNSIEISKKGLNFPTNHMITKSILNDIREICDNGN